MTKKFVYATCLLAAAIVTACDKQQAQQSPGPTETFATERPHYPASEFLRLSGFRATVLSKTILAYPSVEKGTSNFIASISLEREGGGRLAVTFRPATEELLRNLDFVKEGHSYTFPDVLRSGKE